MKPLIIHSLTGLRFYAALIVFFSHLYLFNYFSLTQGMMTTYMEEIGWVGVSLFFNLSGFVLFLNYQHKIKTATFDFKQFYLARFARIYPLFFLATLIAAPLEWFHQDGANVFIQRLLLTLGLVHCFDAQACSAFNGPGWSLSHEAFFYFLFPLLAFALFIRQPFKRLLVFLLCYALYLTAILWIAPETYAAQATFPINRTIEFVSGMFGGYLFSQYADKPGILRVFQTKGVGVLSVVAVATLVVTMSLRTFITQSYPLLGQCGYLFSIVPAFTVILLLAFLEKAGREPKFLVNRFVLLAGEISFSFYLIHHLIMRYSIHIARVAFHMDLQEMKWQAGIALTMVELTLSLLLSWVLYTCVEKPCRKFILSRRKPQFFIPVPKTAG